MDGSGTTDSGGAVTAFTVGGTTTAAVNLTGGEGANGKDNDATTSGVGGAITTSTFTGLVTGDVAVSGGGGIASNFALRSGKWYWEFYIKAQGNLSNSVGIMDVAYGLEGDNVAGYI